MAKRGVRQEVADVLEGYDPARPETLGLVNAAVRKQLPLYFLEMIPTQEKFIRVRNQFGRMPKTRLFEAGNQCNTQATLIETPEGEISVGELYRRGVPFRVYAWSGRERVEAWALAPFSKGWAERCYRVTVGDGRWIETSGDHLLLCGDGVYRAVSGLSSLLPGGVSAFLPVGNQIVSIDVIDGQEVFDFTVPGHHNYYAAGLVNHNSGKSLIGVAEDIAHAMGFRPWLRKDDPDYKVPVRVPNNGLVGCEVAGQTLSQNIEPKFMELLPKFSQPDITRYSDGSIKSLQLTYDYEGKYCGSTVHFRSYVQPADTYEGSIWDWIHWDEPPPQAILNAAERGKMKTNAPSWDTMTPLKEPYIYDLFTVHAFNGGGEDQEIAIFRCSTWENCQDWCRDCDCTIEENRPERLKADEVRPVSHCPKCGRVMGFMPRAGIENYLKKITDPDEREAREEGKWKHLSGLVYKELSREEHQYEDFDIPRSWMRIEVVDPHDARPTRWLMGAVSPEEIEVNGKQVNRIYWYTYLLPSGTIDAIVRAVKVKRAEMNYREPEMVILDAKYGSKIIHTSMEETSWEEELGKAGIKRIRLSHSAPGDIALGHKVVKEYLRPHFSAVKGKSFPGMLFARRGCSGTRGPAQDMWNYMWDIKNPDRPEEQYKDMADCVRYAALEQPIYRVPRPEIDEDLARMILSREDQLKEANPLFYGLSMRS